MPAALPIVCPGHARPVVSLQFREVPFPGGPPDLFLVSACHDKKPMLRRGETGDWVGTFEGHKGAVWDCELNADATLAATASADSSARVWDAITGKSLLTLEHTRVVRAAVFDPEGGRLCTGGDDKVLRLWSLERSADAEESEMRSTSSSQQMSGTSQVQVRKALWPTPNQLITGGVDKVVRQWDPRTNEQPRTCEIPNEIRDLEIQPDGNTLLVAAKTHVVEIDLAANAVRRQITTARDVDCACKNPVGDEDACVVGGAADSRVYVLDLTTGKECNELPGHHGPVHAARFAPAGDKLATGSDDSSIRLWDVAAVFPPESAS